MAIPNFLEAGAFGILNDILSGFHDNNGYAQPNRYEVLILPPAKLGGGNQTNIFSGLERQGDTRSISLRAQSVNLPGRNLATSMIPTYMAQKEKSLKVLIMQKKYL